MKPLVLVLIAACLSFPASAGDQADREKAEEVARTFANCAGLWDFLSAVELADDKPATAEQLKNTGNGAQMAALYWLAAAHALGGGEPRPYGDWLPMVTPHRESSAVQIAALVEQGASSEISQQAELCTALVEEQDRILTDIRRGFVGVP